MDQFEQKYDQLKKSILDADFKQMDFIAIKEFLIEHGYQIDNKITNLQELITYFEGNGTLNMENVDIFYKITNIESCPVTLKIDVDEYIDFVLPEMKIYIEDNKGIVHSLHLDEMLTD